MATNNSSTDRDMNRREDDDSDKATHRRDNSADTDFNMIDDDPDIEER
jgi:hypothetical protein